MCVCFLLIEFFSDGKVIRDGYICEYYESVRVFADVKLYAHRRFML